jgi:hypothetical protein
MQANGICPLATATTAEDASQVTDCTDAHAPDPLYMTRYAREQASDVQPRRGPEPVVLRLGVLTVGFGGEGTGR